MDANGACAIYNSVIVQAGFAAKDYLSRCSFTYSDVWFAGEKKTDAREYAISLLTASPRAQPTDKKAGNVLE